MPLHGESRSRFVFVTFNNPPRSFEAPNGEGLIVLEGKQTTPEERRWCSKCQKWIHVVGTLAHFQADYVGCLKCGKPWPAWSKRT